MEPFDEPLRLVLEPFQLESLLVQTLSVSLLQDGQLPIKNFHIARHLLQRFDLAIAFGMVANLVNQVDSADSQIEGQQHQEELPQWSHDL